MIGKWHCLYIVIFLYGGAIIVLFVRAFVRRTLLKDHDENTGTRTRSATNKLSSILLAIPHQIKALRELGQSLTDMPTDVQRRYRLLQLLTWMATIFLILLIAYSIVAHKICEV
jgi:hypothetical protein